MPIKKIPKRRLNFKGLHSRLSAKLVLTLASTVILSSESYGTHDHILLSGGSGSLRILPSEIHGVVSQTFQLFTTTVMRIWTPTSWNKRQPSTILKTIYNMLSSRWPHRTYIFENKVKRQGSLPCAPCPGDIWWFRGVAASFLTSVLDCCSSYTCRFTTGEWASGARWIWGWVGLRVGLEAVE
jgi:hypothetical protein